MANLETINGAQSELDQALQDFCIYRRIVDDSEDGLYPPFLSAFNRIKYILQTLPDGIQSISVHTQFDRVTNETKNYYPGYTGSALLNLQKLLDQVTPKIKSQNPVNFEFIVKPNVYPEELRKITFGSRSRELEMDIFETINARYDWGYFFLGIKPYGSPEGMGGLWAREMKPYNVPLAVVKRIELHREQRSLTPYLKGQGFTNLSIIPVIYQS